MSGLRIASEALARGELTEFGLHRRFRRVLPGVWAPNTLDLDLPDRAEAAWLWSGRRGVVGGLAASAMLGAKWVDDNVPVELYWSNYRAPEGVVVRKGLLLPDEVQTVRGVPTTTALRTAVDLARVGTVAEAVARLDALVRATQIDPSSILAVAERHRNIRGLARVPRVVGLVDAGAQSPKESWLRLVLVGGGYPRPGTQIPILGPDGRVRYYIDMGWEGPKIGVEYDGQQHRLDDRQYHGDIRRSEYLASLGWRIVRVVAGDSRADVLARVAELFAQS
ncbi:DUF559 domain-containing protein [Mycolicibacterium insubricum]|uniref:DUF559 domain-containing protein n=1 Tax=Mycolicibacterium insubricum TaxID=444597 RepID=A0A1X0DC29_9MYCO|nr:DUF559 domain-containing protein [Mycolicibacterium insubricum]MCV7080618.1 DUF559 domain-containing protein [Mycolicibacterium insubricum]ORA69931.1 hypothetical protein BST26_12290 [Mycolicibacterium insubricum]